jgi:Zn-dependent peptidase ImmA (M78 family)/transcriptional regulator with XRE-family HTH domain
VTIGARVRQVRELRGLTQSELADRTGVTQPRVRQIESMESPPTDAWLFKVAAATGYPVAFFRQPLAAADDFPLGSMLFWGQAAMTKRERRQAHRAGQILFDVTERLLRRFPPVVPRIPELDGRTSPHDAAEMTRAALGLSPDQPVPNLIRRLENSGVVVLAVPLQNDHHEAYSLWAGRSPARPVVVLLGDQHGDLQRWSTAHELGHLVLHRTPPANFKSGEEEAHQFARQFLLPADALLEELPESVSLSGLAPLKQRWGVSIQTLVRRAHDLERITDRQYRYLFQQIGARGWRDKRTWEPAHLAVPLEKPRALMKMIEKVYGPDVDYVKVAADLHLPVFELQELLRRQAGSPADSASRSADATVTDLAQLRQRREA